MQTLAKKSIAGFRVRELMPLGAKVTLRGDRMYEFLDRLITVALPRVRDFRGVKGNAFDGRGNYAMGLKEHIVFPEINFDKVDEVWGMDIIICTTAKTDAEAKALLKHVQHAVQQLSLERTMAKKSMVEREVKRQKLVDQYAARRAALKAMIEDQSKPMEERFKATLKLAKLPRNSSATPAAQPLPAHRASARLLPQAEGQPDHAARAWLAGADPRPCEIELVRRA